MDGTVLITGCSTGIGYETARTFLDDGWTVYATSREPADVLKLAKNGARIATLDVTDQTEVADVANRLRSEVGHLDCLVNNAGYGQFGPIEDIPTELVARQFNVNVLGPHRLMRAILPLMREQGTGRIVNVTSADDRIVLPGIGVYSASKFALRAMTDALRQELCRTGIDVVVLEPGLVATEFYRRAGEGVEYLDRTPAYAKLYRLLDFIDRFEHGGPGVTEPRRVAQCITEIATVEQPDAYYQVGRFATAGRIASAAVKGRRWDRATCLGLDLLSREWLLDLAAPTPGRSD